MIGAEIKKIRTLGSKYDNGHILEAFTSDGQCYRISTTEIIKLFNGNVILDTKKKRIYEHLTIR